MTIVHVVDMVAVFHSLVPACGPVLVVVTAVLSMGKRALVPVLSVGVMGMALVNEVGMAFMLDDGMSAGRPMDMVVIGVNRMISCTHGSSSV
jgi:hypothetical protein